MAKEKLVKLVIFVPSEHAGALRKAIAEAGAGHIGNYDSCSFSSPGVGRFRPLEGSDPFIGSKGVVEEVREEKVETICTESKLKEVLVAVKAAHPYEEPAIDIFPLLNHLYL